MSELLEHLVYEWSQCFCEIQCMSAHRISAIPCEWVVAEFLWHPANELLQNFCNTQVYEWSQNFCDTQCTELSQNFCDTQYMSDRIISATLWVLVVTEFLQHPVYKWLQNFSNIQGVSGSRISATSSGLVVAEFLQHSVHESLQNFCNIQWQTVGRLDGFPLHLFMIVH